MKKIFMIALATILCVVATAAVFILLHDMHSGSYKTRIFPWGTRYICIDSSKASRHHTILHSEGIEIWKDIENIDLTPIT